MTIASVAVALCLAGTGIYWWWCSRLPRFDFDGLVVDGNGVGVPNATVELRSHDVGGDLFGYERRWAVTTDSLGGFSLRRERGEELDVSSVRKPGMLLLTDLAANHPRAAGLSNGEFVFAGLAHYVHDPRRPAIYVLITLGTSAATRPSRGGADYVWDQAKLKRIENAPREPLVPSVIGGAEATPAQIQKAFDALAP